MILKEYGKYRLICDNCDEIIETYDSWDEAVEGKKEQQVKSSKIDGKWIDVCYECQEEI